MYIFVNINFFLCLKMFNESNRAISKITIIFKTVRLAWVKKSLRRCESRKGTTSRCMLEKSATTLGDIFFSTNCSGSSNFKLKFHLFHLRNCTLLNYKWSDLIRHLRRSLSLSMIWPKNVKNLMDVLMQKLGSSCYSANLLQSSYRHESKRGFERDVQNKIIPEKY